MGIKFSDMPKGRNWSERMGMRFKNIPKDSFETVRKALFKPEDGVKNMAYAETIEIGINVSVVRNEETRKELEAFADITMEKVQKIIAEHEAPQ